MIYNVFKEYQNKTNLSKHTKKQTKENKIIKNNLENTESKLAQSPGKVAVTCKELQYNGNSYKNNNKHTARLSPTHSLSKRLTCCIYKSSLVVIGLQLI